MKKLVGGLLLLGAFALSNAQTITFDKTTIDYGTVKANSDGNRVFTFTNTGNKPLIISNVQPGCGCTASDWTKEPILPGKKGEIKVHYNTATVAPFKKTIDVFSNDPANGRIVLYIQGTVVNADTNIAAPATPVKEVAAPVVSTNTKATQKVKKVSKAKKS
jgi:hypothetical protein